MTKDITELEDSQEEFFHVPSFSEIVPQLLGLETSLSDDQRALVVGVLIGMIEGVKAYE